MARIRIEIKLTKKLDSSTWRWQATKLARRGIISTAQLPLGARVNDVLTVEVSSALEGSVVRRVISPEQANAAKSETMTEGPKSPRENRQRKPRSSKQARSAENRRVASLVRELTTLGDHEKAIRLCEERGWEPTNIDPRLWRPQLGRSLGDIYPWLWEAADEPLDFEERLLSLRVLWRYGIYTHGLLAEKSFDELQALRGLGNAKLALLDRYFKERAETSPVPRAAPRQKRRTKESGLGVVDPGPWQPQLGRSLGDIYPWLWEATDEPLDFEERLLSLRILWRHGIYTHGLLAEKSFDELQALRGLGKTKLSFLDSYLKERSETSPVLRAASRQKRQTEAARPGGEETLESILSLALERLKYENTFVLRHLHNPPMTLQAIADQESVTREAIRGRLKRDESRLAPFKTVSVVQAAAEELSAEIGPLCSLDDSRLEVWRQKLGPEPFELFCWLAGYTYQGINLVNRERLEAASTHLDDVAQSRWLIHEDELISPNESSAVKRSAAQDALSSNRWRDIGEGWHVRWDGTLSDKAERVLRLLGEPTNTSDLIRHLGQGAESTLRNYISESEVFIRTDANFTVALAEWGLEEYEGIATEIAQRIERGGGVASRSAIIEEFTTDFGVKEQSVLAYLGTEMFAVTGDKVRFADLAQVSPGDPRSVEGALLSAEGWGQIVEVTDDHLQGYSILLDRRVCYPNGIRPTDHLEVEVVGFPGAVASVIWRTTSVNKRVEVGRLSNLLNEASVTVGSRILVVPLKNGVHLFIGDEAIRNALPRSGRAPTQGNFRVRKSSVAGKYGQPQRL